MGRKAKDAAQQKIGKWIGVHRNVSNEKTKTTTAETCENTNASDENSSPIETQNDINAMKNCTVRLENILMPSKNSKTIRKTPAKKVPAAETEIKDTQAKAKVYEYSFDADSEGIPLQTGNEDAMKDLIEKLAAENKIEVKKYRPKNVKKKKMDEKVPTKKGVARKRHREKQPIDVEPPQKKSNLKNKVTTAIGKQLVSVAPILKQKHVTENSANNNNAVKKTVNIVSNKITTANATAINTDHSKANAQPKLRNRNLNNNFQSTPKSSTPLGAKTVASNQGNNRSLNSGFFDNVSPLMSSMKNTRGNITKHRLQLSAIDDSQEEALTSAAHNIENCAAPQSIDYDNDGFNFNFDDNVANEADHDMDKENSLDRPGTSAETITTTIRPQTRTMATSAMQNRIESRSVASTSSGSNNAANATPRNTNDHSIFDMQNESEYHIFSPTKRRVYGRSPLKNITNEVNNTNSPIFDSIKSNTAVPRGFGSLTKSTLSSIPVNNISNEDITLPEGSYFAVRPSTDDFDPSINCRDIIDDCFGFHDDDDDDEIDNNNDDTLTEKSERSTEPTKDNLQSKKDTGPLDQLRTKLKRFLNNPDGTDETVKKSKIDVNAKFRKKRVKSPKKLPPKSPAKIAAPTSKNPIKRNVVFAETGAKQKDIRNAFSGNTNKHTKINPEAPILFEEIETKQDRRRSYSRPQRQRKRRISIDCEESEEEQQSEDEEFDVHGKKTKRAKRRKKTAEANPKELEELEEFAKKTNAHFDEVDSFELIVE